MDNDSVLKAIEISGPRAPNGEDELRQYLKLVDEGYLRRIPVKPLPGDTNAPFICELTMQGRQKINHR